MTKFTVQVFGLPTVIIGTLFFLFFVLPPTVKGPFVISATALLVFRCAWLILVAVFGLATLFSKDVPVTGTPTI